MKTIRYAGNNKQSGQAVYSITGSTCVFSGLTYIPSTIQFAERVIASICLNASIHPRELSFYDLQTHRGYKIFQPGVCKISKLELTIESVKDSVFWTFLKRGELKYAFSIKSWTDAECSDAVMEKFSHYSGCSTYDPASQEELRLISYSVKNIFDAAYRGIDAAVEKYLDEGGDIEAKECDGNGIVHAAARGGKLSICRLLKERHANMNAVNNYNQTAYDIVCQLQDTKIKQELMEFFCEVGIDTNTQARIMYYENHEEEFEKTPW